MSRMDEIKGRRAKITPAPWTIERGFICSGGYERGISIAQMDSDIAASDKDGEFIANAPEDIDFLLSEIDRLERRRILTEYISAESTASMFGKLGGVTFLMSIVDEDDPRLPPKDNHLNE